MIISNGREAARAASLIENPRADRIGNPTAVVIVDRKHFVFLPVVQAA